MAVSRTLESVLAAGGFEPRPDDNQSHGDGCYSPTPEFYMNPANPSTLWREGVASGAKCDALQAKTPFAFEKGACEV